MPQNFKQVKRPPLPAEHHVARYCNPQHVKINTMTKQFEGIFPSAFELRPEIKEVSLSTEWFEKFAGSLIVRLTGILAIWARKKLHNPRAAIAVLQVDYLVSTARNYGVFLRITNLPWVSDSYVGIDGLPKDNSYLNLRTEWANHGCVHLYLLSQVLHQLTTTSSNAPQQP